MVKEKTLKTRESWVTCGEPINKNTQQGNRQTATASAQGIRMRPSLLNKTHFGDRTSRHCKSQPGAYQRVQTLGVCVTVAHEALNLADEGQHLGSQPH